MSWGNQHRKDILCVLSLSKDGWDKAQRGMHQQSGRKTAQGLRNGSQR